ncbi:MAG: type II toxin-antitoxin system HicB family antitoxin [Gallicola sp.]|nr:type II toxin-antitoxin system HicB family antitoxin [Gallicola sp.]
MYKTPYSVAYPFIFHSEENGGYFIESVDVQGAYTGINSENVAEGIAMAEEVLGMVLADMVENSEALPIPTPIKEVQTECDAFVTLISVDVEEYFKDTELVKKTLSIPKWANTMGNRIGINFSRLLTDAIAEAATNLSNK